MFYKSSILAAVFVLLSMGNAIAADLSNIENFIAEQQSELIVNEPNLQSATTKNSASIAKARLLKVPTTDTLTAAEPSISTNQNSASIAKARLHSLSAKESAAFNSLPTARSITPKVIKGQIKTTVYTPSSPIAYFDIAQHQSLVPEVIAVPNTNNQPELNSIPAILGKSTEQHKIANASSELSAIEQWEVNKSVTLTDVSLTNISLTSPPTVAQAPERLPDNSIPSAVIEAKPAIAKPITPKITPSANEATTKPTAPIIETKEPQTPKIVEAQKPNPQNNESKKWAVGVHTQFSTTGFVGVDAGYKFSPNLHARLGLNTVGFNVDYASQGIDYKAKFNPTNVHLLGDFFPFGGGLRLTGGLVFQSNQFDATGTPNASAIPGGIPTQINLGGVNYNVSDVGTVSSQGSFSNSVAPYLGIGFGTPLSPGLGFNFDAGVMFAGSANVRLRANIPSSVPAALQDQIRSSLAEQERRTNNDIAGFSVYPVVSVGLSYAF
jgi:hypothetical protein